MFTLSRARTTGGFLAAVGFFPATALCCVDALAALVSRSLAEVLQWGALVKVEHHVHHTVKKVYLNQAVIFWTVCLMTCHPAHIKSLSGSKSHLAPTLCRQGSQSLTWAQAWCSCLAKCPLCPFWAITLAASPLWTFRTLPPSLPSSAPAPLAVVVCRSTGQHTWRVTQMAYTLLSHFQYYTVSPDYGVCSFECSCSIFCSYLAPMTTHYHTINMLFKTVTHTLMESCCVEEFLLSAEAEDIWGFTRAIEMVGGVSLVIFLLCNGMD